MPCYEAAEKIPCSALTTKNTGDMNADRRLSRNLTHGVQPSVPSMHRHVKNRPAAVLGPWYGQAHSIRDMLRSHMQRAGMSYIRHLVQPIPVLQVQIRAPARLPATIFRCLGSKSAQPWLDQYHSLATDRFLYIRRSRSFFRFELNARYFPFSCTRLG